MKLSLLVAGLVAAAALLPVAAADPLTDAVDAVGPPGSGCKPNCESFDPTALLPPPCNPNCLPGLEDPGA